MKWGFLAICTAVLAVLKLVGVITWSWWWILAPAMIVVPAVLVIVALWIAWFARG